MDEEMLHRMIKAGGWTIAWGIESAKEQILKKASKGYRLEQAPRALKWANEAGIQNTGCFITGFPGETVDTVKDTVALAKELPLDTAPCQLAAPYSGTLIFFDVLEDYWFRFRAQWHSADMDQSAVLDDPNLKSEQLLYWQKRAFRECAFRPGPIWTRPKGVNSPAVVKSAIEVVLGTLNWARGRNDKFAARSVWRNENDCRTACPL